MNPPTHTTLAALAAHNPCKPGRDRLLAGLGKTEADDEPLALVKVLEICGLQDALWCIDHVWHDKLRMRLACRFVREVAHLMPQGSRDALEVVERYAEGGASEDALKEAAAATATPVYASRAARCTTYATNSAAYAARAAWYTATAYARAEEKVIYAKQVQILREFLTQMEGGAA